MLRVFFYTGAKPEIVWLELKSVWVASVSTFVQIRFVRVLVRDDAAAHVYVLCTSHFRSSRGVLLCASLARYFICNSPFLSIGSTPELGIDALMTQWWYWAVFSRSVSITVTPTLGRSCIWKGQPLVLSHLARIVCNREPSSRVENRFIASVFRRKLIVLLVRNCSHPSRTHQISAS